MILIGSARIAENGTINGKRGDQTGKECSTQEYYNHTKGWVVLRAKEQVVRDGLAYAMKGICDNNHFGYGQDDRLSGYNACKSFGFDPYLVNIDCNIDCSEAVRVCCAFAGIKVADFYTGNEKEILLATKCFDEISAKPEELIAGDILVTKTKGHTAIVIEGEGVWEQLSDGSWVYHREQGLVKGTWMIVNHHWYLFGDDGIMKTGWQQSKGEWYYLEESNNEGFQGACWHETPEHKGALERWNVI